MNEIHTWRHVFKLDPNKTLTDEQIGAVCESGTDAIIVGGTDDVTLDDVLHLLAVTRRYAVPIVLEVTHEDMICPGFDYYFLPTVINSPDAKWITQNHITALKSWGHMINWDETFGVAYCICNPDCKAGVVTGVTETPTVDDIEAYATLADQMFRMPIFYMEYSGTYGDPALLQEAKRTLQNAHLFYGGGIKTKEQAREMSAFAHTIVVGNALYESFQEALQTVKAVKEK
ncbi:MAG: heptaprenylglyceryl phosphate synthase [Bacilli bacterium]